MKEKPRREYGSGTYRRLGTDAAGLAIVQLVVDVPGVKPRRRATRRIHCRARDIEKELAAFRDKAGRRAEGTVSDLLDRWLYSRRGKASKTYARWEGIVRNHLVPALGGRKVCDLKPLEVDDYLVGLASGGRKRVRKGESAGLSSRTIHHHYSVLRQAFAWAVKKKLIDYTQNPMTAVDAPQVEEVERRAMSNAEMASLVRAARDTDLFVPIVLAATTGARRGEIVGLTWDAVDLDKGVMHIRQAVTRVKGVTTVKQPKSKSSRATLVLLDETIIVLRAEQERQRRLEADPDGWRNLHDLVCPARDGEYANPESMSAKFCRLRDRLVKAGQLAAPYRLHDLRHYHLTEYQHESKDPEATKARGRHASLQMTDRYVHSSLDEQRKIADALDATMGAALRRAAEEDGTHLALLHVVE